MRFLLFFSLVRETGGTYSILELLSRSLLQRYEGKGHGSKRKFYYHQKNCEGGTSSCSSITVKEPFAEYPINYYQFPKLFP